MIGSTDIIKVRRLQSSGEAIELENMVELITKIAVV